MWIDNINLFGGIVVAAEELTLTQNKRKKELFNKLKENINDEEKLQCLLELARVEPQRYTERYLSNIGLLQGTELEAIFEGGNGSTFFTVKEIREISKNVSVSVQQEAINSILEKAAKQEKSVLEK